MDTFYQRLLEEKTQLNERIDKLTAFLDSDKTQGIDPQQLPLLNIQLRAMLTYDQVLATRINLLEPAAVQE